MHKQKVVFIDDDATNNYLTQLTIEFDNIPVTAHLFEWAQKALDFLEGCHQSGDFPTMLFVDVNMPIMDGFEFAQRYERQFYPHYPNTKLFLITSSIRNSDRARAFNNKAIKGFFIKPFTQEVFEKALLINNKQSDNFYS